MRHWSPKLGPLLSPTVVRPGVRSSTARSISTEPCQSTPTAGSSPSAIRPERAGYEVWLQLRGESPEDRRIPATDRTLGLTHNLGGYPGEMVSFVGIYGTEPG